MAYIINLFCILFSDWAGLDEDEDAHVWEDNWDDDNVEDDFSNQLRSLENFQYMQMSKTKIVQARILKLRARSDKAPYSA